MKADVKNIKTWCGRSELDHRKREEEGNEVFCHFKVLKKNPYRNVFHFFCAFCSVSFNNLF